ncbi:Hsp20/alpha crystallin family protein [Leisingera aquaemixtae]|uniref:Hsp20/alpha crystallin family protein n=1 Tax=Leisingera aquaemixtae TaxID=1396826 RepID=UPI001C9465F2|nr:Hsp20/alpha crystallin family protein [Leisingera aquaemixtae]MBY6069428.1 Hsp20/alpha crystallin family protein [Leisingera aquaemixtae]
MTRKAKVPVARETAPAQRSPALSPWGGFGTLREEMERLFDAFEPRSWFSREGPDFGSLRTEMALSPAIDLTENGTEYSVTAELPGLDPESIEVKTSNGTLSISGEKTEEKQEDEPSYHLSERRWGSFFRSVRLPDNIDQDKISATFSNGVLTVHLPKSEAAIASEKKIAVKAA